MSRISYPGPLGADTRAPFGPVLVIWARKPHHRLAPTPMEPTNNFRGTSVIITDESHPVSRTIPDWTCRIVSGTTTGHDGNLKEIWRTSALIADESHQLSGTFHQFPGPSPRRKKLLLHQWNEWRSRLIWGKGLMHKTGRSVVDRRIHPNRDVWRVRHKPLPPASLESFTSIRHWTTSVFLVALTN